MLNASPPCGKGFSEPGPNCTGAWKLHRSEQFDDVGVHGILTPEGEDAGELRPGTLHRHLPRFGLRVAGMEQPRSVAIEDESTSSSTSLIICSRTFVPWIARLILSCFRRPQMGVAFLLGPLRSVMSTMTRQPVARSPCTTTSPVSHQTTRPSAAIIDIRSRVALVADRLFAEPHRPLAVIRVKVIRPECRFGQPALHR